MLTTNTLRPGLLVSLKTTISGNVRYDRQTVESEHIIESGAAKSAWETTRIINDPEEHERAIKARGKARTAVTSICAQSSFGLLCPESAESDLEKAVAEARRIADEFNATATLSRIGVYVITGRVARDDVEAVRAINSEVRQLLADMETGIRNLDVKTIRDAANKSRELGAMLTPEAAAKVQEAIETARATARRIVKAGEQAGQEIDYQAIRKITEQRTAFLDMDDMKAIKAPEMESRAVDFEPAGEPETAPEAVPETAPAALEFEPVTIAAPAVAAPALEFE